MFKLSKWGDTTDVQDGLGKVQVTGETTQGLENLNNIGPVVGRKRMIFGYPESTPAPVTMIVCPDGEVCDGSRTCQEF